MRNIVCNKKSGSGVAIEMLPVLITIVLLGGVLIVYASWMNNLEKKQKLDMIGKEYMLRMESNGYLTSGQKELLIDDLEKEGITEISLEGTTFEKVGFSEIVILWIRGKIKMNKYQIPDFFQWDLKEEKREVEVRYSSTALCK